nr:ac81-like protein [Calliteara abietis nucleopolyhedrovirus]
MPTAVAAVTAAATAAAEAAAATTIPAPLTKTNQTPAFTESPLTTTTTTTTTTTAKPACPDPQTTSTTWFPRLRDKNLTTLNRIKYDSELLLHYLYDVSPNHHLAEHNDNNVNNNSNNNNKNFAVAALNETAAAMEATGADYDYDSDSLESYRQSVNGGINVIKICKARVMRTCGTLLAHYYAQIEISNGYKFEFHPGSQPRTFQQLHSEGHIIIILIYCDACCKKELTVFVEGENDFNVAFRNCESILCKRKSMQTIFVSMALVAVALNMFYFSWYYIFFVLFLLLLLYLNNNYIISSPRVVFCEHKRKLQNA